MRNQKSLPTIFTIGHATRATEDFIAILKAHSVEKLVDIRTIPRSRKNPQFNLDTLPSALRTTGIEYVHMKELGGLRHSRADSVNAGWRNLSFRGYADYMQTPEFREGLARLEVLAKGKQIVIMCAEAVPWRCHRSLVGDALIVRGYTVEDIMNRTSRQRHALTPWAKVNGVEISYSLEQETEKVRDKKGTR